MAKKTKNKYTHYTEAWEMSLPMIREISGQDTFSNASKSKCK